MRRLLAAAAISALTAGAALAAEPQSVSQIAFSPQGTLFVADWKAGALQAYELPAEPGGRTEPFNLLDLDATLSAALGSDDFEIVDLAVRPGAATAYVAVNVGADRRPAILKIASDGRVEAIDLGRLQSTSLPLGDAPDADTEFWGRIPERSFTVTDMVWHGDELFVSGLSNQDFASTLRRVSYPFDGAAETTSIEIYHASHNQVETRAPIRTMAFATIGGVDYLVAAYTCTPLVLIPVSDLTNGAHIRGKTVAELGFGNTPADMVTYSLVQNGQPTDYVLLVNNERSSDLIPVSQLEAANAKPGFTTPVPFGQIQGVEPMQLPFAGVTRVANLDDQYLLALRTDLRSGNRQLVSFNKQANFRLSDFVSEYNFPGYRYDEPYQVESIRPVQNMLKTEEGFADDVVR